MANSDQRSARMGKPEPRLVSASWLLRGMCREALPLTTDGKVEGFLAGSVTDFVRLLHRAVQPPAFGARAIKRVELERVDLLSLLAAASWNINFMLLERFLSELGFRTTHQLRRAHRISADLPVVILVAEFTKAVPSSIHAFLVYAECGRFRVSAAFLDDAVGFIRGSDVVTYPVTALSDDLLTRSSAHGFYSRTAH